MPNLQKELKNQETKLYNLTDLLLEDRINKDDFDRRKKGIKEDICNLEKEIGGIGERRDEKIDSTTDFFQFVNTAVNSFNNGNVQARRSIFTSLGQNFVLKDGELAIELYPWIKLIEKISSNLTREYRRFKTDKKSTTISDSNAYDGIYLKWQQIVYLVRNSIMDYEGLYRTWIEDRLG